MTYIKNVGHKTFIQKRGMLRIYSMLLPSCGMLFDMFDMFDMTIMCSAWLISNLENIINSMISLSPFSPSIYRIDVKVNVPLSNPTYGEVEALGPEYFTNPQGGR